jgi:hypothetical protein
MVAASQLLYDLLRMKNLEAYPAHDLRSHIQMAVAKTTSRGFRIVKDIDMKRVHKIDGAIALAMACHAAIESGGVDTSVPVRITSPFADMSVWKDEDEAQKRLPWPLRE